MSSPKRHAQHRGDDEAEHDAPQADHDVGHELRVAEQGQRIVVHLDRPRHVREADVEIPAVGGARYQKPISRPIETRASSIAGPSLQHHRREGR
jgi:hypothetical protein